MLGRIVTILKRLVGSQSSPVLGQAEVLVSNSAKPLRVKSGRPSKAAQAQHQSSQPAQSKPKRKSKAAPSTKAVASRKSAKKAAPAESGVTGKQPKTPVRRTRQHAK